MPRSTRRRPMSTPGQHPTRTERPSSVLTQDSLPLERFETTLPLEPFETTLPLEPFETTRENPVGEHSRRPDSKALSDSDSVETWSVARGAEPRNTSLWNKNSSFHEGPSLPVASSPNHWFLQLTSSPSCTGHGTIVRSAWSTRPTHSAVSSRNASTEGTTPASFEAKRLRSQHNDVISASPFAACAFHVSSPRRSDVNLSYCLRCAVSCWFCSSRHVFRSTIAVLRSATTCLSASSSAFCSDTCDSTCALQPKREQSRCWVV